MMWCKGRNVLQITRIAQVDFSEDKLLLGFWVLKAMMMMMMMQVQDFHITKSDKEIGFYAGLLGHLQSSLLSQQLAAAELNWNCSADGPPE